MQTTLTWLLAGMAALMLHAGTAAAAEASDTQVPDACQQPNLSLEVQRLCDQLQFAGEPHYHVVRLAGNGAVRSVRLLETGTGREVFTSYPHGVKFAIPDQDDRELRIRAEELEGALEGRPTPAGAVAAQQETPAPAGFATGLPIGWNSSTGPTSGQCLNYTIAPPSNHVEQTSFTSQNTATSTAEQIRVSASVNVAFDLFQASDTFSISDQWRSSTNSSNQYFNAYSLYTLTTTVPRSDPLNAQGQEHQTDDDFETLCGTEYLASVPVGMVVTLSINYGSSSASTQMTISNQFSLNFGLDSLTTAVETASADESSSSYFTFSMVLYGGGTASSAALHKAFAAENTADQAFYALCAQGNTEACSQFTSSMGQGIATALDSFNQQVEGLSGATDPDLSFLQTFPHGVAGASTSQAVTTAIPLPSSDVLAPYASQLQDVLRLLDQIATLNNRVLFLQGLFMKEPDLNPAELLDLVSYLDRLQNIYNADRVTLRKNLGNCLEATSDKVTSICQPIINNQTTNAYEYYGLDGPGSSFFAQQNTLALQYTGVDNTPAGFPVPLDVLYIDELPPFTAAPSPVPIAGEAAFVGFADRPVQVPGEGTLLIPEVDILALEPHEPLSTNNVSTEVRATPAASSPFTFWTASVISSEALIEGIPGARFTSTSCTPTFANPCAINYIVNFPNGRSTIEHRQIEGLFPVD